MQTWLARLVVLVACVESTSFSPDDIFSLPPLTHEDDCTPDPIPFPVAQTCPLEETQLLEGVSSLQFTIKYFTKR